MPTDEVTKLPDRSHALRLLLTVVLLNGFLMALALYSVMDSKAGYEEKARLTTQNLARMLDQSIAGSVGKIELTLLGVVDELERQLRERGRLDSSHSQSFLLTHQRRLTELSSLRVADASGLVVLGEGVAASSPASWADRDFFRLLRDQADLGMVVTKPILGRVNNIWIISFVRRFNQTDGSFAGVVSASIPVSYLGTLLSALDVGPKGIAVLRDASLGLVVRHPVLDTPAGAIGAAGFSRELGDGIASGVREFSYHSKRTADGVERTSFYRRMSSLPFHISVGLGSDDYLAAWTLGVQRTMGSLVFFILATSLLGWQLWRTQIKRSLADRQREQAEKGVKLERERLANILWGTGVGTWEWNVQTGETRFNERWAELIGYTLSELAPISIATWMKFAHPDDLSASGAALDKHFAGLADAYECESRMRHKQGHWIWVLDRGKLVSRTPDGKPEWMAGTHWDITERKTAEEALQKESQALARSNAELEQFAYVASHDLRQPLRMVNSYVQLLERALADKLDGETREMMHFAADGAKRMDQMLVSLLEYSRVGRKGEPKRALNSLEAVNEALRFLAPAIAEAQATVRVSGDWPQVLASPDEFTRLWQNLVGNAVKYRAPDRVPEIHITVSNEPDGAGWRFCVADNGIGIDPGQFHRLFKVFQRLHARDQYEGNGIGLAVASKIVERHGGRIWVESGGAGQGCRFCFVLPLRGTDREGSL